MKNETTSIIKKNYASIDIMRGLAVSLVIMVHTKQSVSGGSFILNVLAQYSQMGVQLFFIASAFTLSYSLEIGKVKGERSYNFFLRRFFRIAPGYYSGIIIYMLLNMTVNVVNNDELLLSPKYSLINILANVLFLNGLYPPANNNIVPGGWSIGTEMLFYVLFPILFSIYNYVRVKNKNFHLLIPIAALFITIVIGYIYCITFNTKVINNSFFYFNIINQISVFCVGISMFFLFKDGYINNNRLRTCIIWFLLLSCLSVFLFCIGDKYFILTFSIVPFISGVSFMFLFSILENQSIRSKVLIEVGKVSYSCYLVHFIFVWYLARILDKIIFFAIDDLRFAIIYIICVVCTYIVAKIMYLTIEKNGILLGKMLIDLFNAVRFSSQYKKSL